MTIVQLFYSLWNYYRVEVNNNANENDDAGNKMNNNKRKISNFFEYQTKAIEPDDNNTLDIEVVSPLKHLGNFWRILDFPLINCEVKLDLSWLEKCIITEIPITLRIVGDPDVNPCIQDAIFLFYFIYLSFIWVL